MSERISERQLRKIIKFWSGFIKPWIVEFLDIEKIKEEAIDKLIHRAANPVLRYLDTKLINLEITEEILLRGFDKEDLARELVPIKRFMDIRPSSVLFISATFQVAKVEMELVSKYYVDENMKLRPRVMEVTQWILPRKEPKLTKPIMNYLQNLEGYLKTLIVSLVIRVMELIFEVLFQVK